MFFIRTMAGLDGYPTTNVIYADLSFDLDFEANINTQLLSFSGVLQGNTVAEYLDSTGMFNCGTTNLDLSYKVIGRNLNPHIVAADISKLLGMCFFENEENKYTPFQLNEHMFYPSLHIAEGDTYEWSYENIEQVAQVLFSDIHKFTNFRNSELEKTDLKNYREIYCNRCCPFCACFTFKLERRRLCDNKIFKRNYRFKFFSRYPT